MNTGSTNKKIIQILHRMDEVMRKNGYLHYQERIHRIYKTVLSIHRHTDCYVSKFCADDTPRVQEEQDKEDSENEKENYTSEYLSIQNSNEIEMSSENNSSYKLDLDDLLRFIEDELNIRNLVNESTSSSGSDESDEESNNKEEDAEKFASVKKKNTAMSKHLMHKKFFNIELKLRSYIEEQEALKNNFQSILSCPRSATPISKLPYNPLPVIMSNFFEDRESIKAQLEKAHQRYSVRGSNLKTQLKEFEELQTKKIPASEIPTIKIKKQIKSNVTSFDSDVNVNNEQSAKMQFIIEKRNSLLDQKDMNAVEEEGISDEGESEEESDYTSDEEEYEEESEEENKCKGNQK